MIRFDYGTLLSPSPIELSIGTLIKPRLKDISDSSKGMSFDKFNYFEVILKLSPETFYTKLKGEEGKKYWKSLSEEEQEDMTLYQIVMKEKQLLETFTEIFNFFFEENVIFEQGYFVLLKKGVKFSNNLTQDDIVGVISEDLFPQVINAIQQICCIDDKEDFVDESQFRNKRALKLFYRMRKAAKKAQKERKSDINFTLPNIISSVSNRHPTINPINIWDLTVFQLLDAFNRLQTNSMYDIDSTRVSVWGDEKKTFNASLWYKNDFDRKIASGNAD